MSSSNGFDVCAAGAKRQASAKKTALGRKTSLVPLAVLGIALWSSACKRSDDANDNACTRDRTCVDRLGEGATCNKATGVCSTARAADAGSDAETDLEWPARWQCVNESARAAFEPEPGKTVDIRIKAVDMVTLKVPAGLNAKACNASDSACDAPVVADIEEGDDGYFHAEVPQGFDGYFRFAAQGFVPGIWYYGRPLEADTTVTGPLMISPQTLDQLATFAGVPNDADHGAALVEVWDCDDQAADGVIFRPVAQQNAFYFDGALPARDQTATSISTALGLTGENVAAAGYSFLPSGWAGFAATLIDSPDVTIGQSAALIEAGHITYVRVFPSRKAE